MEHDHDVGMWHVLLILIPCMPADGAVQGRNTVWAGKDTASIYLRCSGQPS